MSNIENKLKTEDTSIHDWYRFVLSFPPHLVRHYLTEFQANDKSLVLDPFSGTGTTNVECKKCGIPSMGIEASPITHFASKTKCTWDDYLDDLMSDAYNVADSAKKSIKTASSFRTLPDDLNALILKNSISPQPLNEILALRDSIISAKSRYQNYFLIALAKHIVYSYSNLKFGPEICINKKKRESVEVVEIWLSEIKRIYTDLLMNKINQTVPANIFLGDSREVFAPQNNQKVDIVITSPPYPNEKDYSRTTRLESVLLGFIKNREDLKRIKKGFIRSNTKNVYNGDDDGKYISNISSINLLSNKIESRRIQLGKTSGFEKLYSSVVKLYFGGMAKHLISLKTLLKNDAYLAYVVGDQASYFQIPIRTSNLLGEVAESLGNYKVVRIDTFRKRFATATDTWLNEDVLILNYKE